MAIGDIKSLLGLGLLPRGGVSKDRLNMEYGDDFQKKMFAFRDAFRDEALSTLEANPEFDQINKYIDLLEGRQWAVDRPSWRSRFVDNRIAKVRQEYLSQLTDIRPTIEVRTSDASYFNEARIINDVILHEWQRMNLDIALADVVDHSLFSTGYWKLGGAAPGFLTASAHGMDTVMPVQKYGDTIQESVGILYRTYKPITYFYRCFGERARGLEKQAEIAPVATVSNAYNRPAHLSDYSWNSLSPAMQYHLGKKMRRPPSTVGPRSFPVVKLEEMWIDDPTINEFNQTVLVKDPYLPLEAHNYWYEVPPGQPLFPFKRLIVWAGDRLMYDGPSPYWHGLYPFTQLCLNPIVWGPGGLSAYRNLIPLQRAINEVGAGTLDTVRKAVNPQIVSKAGVVAQDAWDKFYPDKPGGKLLLGAMGVPQQDVKYLDAPQLPQYVSQFAMYLMQSFRETAGSLDTTQLAKKKQIPSPDTIEKFQETLGTPLKLQSRYIERFLSEAGMQAVSNVIQFFTARQRIRLLGPKGQTMADYMFDPDNMIPAGMRREEFHRLLSIYIQQGSLNGMTHDRAKQEALILGKLGIISKQEVLRKFDYSDGQIQKIIQEIGQEQPPQGMQAIKGGGRTPRTPKEKHQAVAV